MFHHPTSLWYLGDILVTSWNNHCDPQFNVMPSGISLFPSVWSSPQNRSMISNPYTTSFTISRCSPLFALFAQKQKHFIVSKFNVERPSYLFRILHGSHFQGFVVIVYDDFLLVFFLFFLPSQKDLRTMMGSYTGHSFPKKLCHRQSQDGTVIELEWCFPIRAKLSKPYLGIDFDCMNVQQHVLKHSCDQSRCNKAEYSA